MSYFLTKILDLIYQYNDNLFLIIRRDVLKNVKFINQIFIESCIIGQLNCEFNIMNIKYKNICNI